jgi:hypothetical protein
MANSGGFEPQPAPGESPWLAFYLQEVKSYASLVRMAVDSLEAEVGIDYARALAPVLIPKLVQDAAAAASRAEGERGEGEGEEGSSPASPGDPAVAIAAAEAISAAMGQPLPPRVTLTASGGTWVNPNLLRAQQWLDNRESGGPW